MRILLFGGSFDPPHAGHEALLRAALKAVRPDRTLLMPTWRSPLKAGHSAAASDRLAMTRLLASACGGASRGVRADAFELERGKTTYTYQALRRLRRLHTGAEIWLLTGSDAAASIGRWKRHAEVRASCRWIVGRRPGGSIPGSLKAQVLPGVFPDVSSTILRARLVAGMDASGSIPKPILGCISRRGLYAADIHADLRRALAPGRFAHTLAVARLAVSLAERHGLDAERAALAGLLHDAGRRFDPAGVARYAANRRLRIPAKSEILSRNPMLAHAFVSEDLARRRYGVRDRDVLQAIRLHTFGARRMSPLARLLYVADSASEDRGFREAARIRRTAEKDLDAAFLEAVRLKLRCVVEGGQWLHPDASALWNSAVESA